MLQRSRLILGWFAALTLAGTASAADWLHWRGPLQTGYAGKQNLPDTFEVDTVGKNNLIWKQPIGGRSAPLILKGRLYMIGGYDAGQPTEGERVCCFNADTGEKLWEQRFNVFHTDIVSSRLGWTTLAADPDAELIYAHTTGGFLYCFNKDGKVQWQRQLTEEFGRVTGYGGRIVSPVFDQGLVIVGLINASWGDQARGLNRFAAFDGKTGSIVWWGEATTIMEGTYYSTPVVAVINGVRQLITGGADGSALGFNIRTGERLWSYRFCAKVVNPSPVVDGNLVYLCHGEENPEGGALGRIVCLDASQVDAKTKKPKLVWEQKRLSKRYGLASPALHEGRLYLADDSAELSCVSAKDGRLLWKKKYGTVSRGAPMIADNKLYIFDVNAKLMVMTLNGDREPKEELDREVIFRGSGRGFVETHGTPVAVNGKLYFLTRDDLYCIGKAGSTGELPTVRIVGEKPYDPNAEPAALRIYPADVTTNPTTPVKLTVEFLDANGRVLPKKKTATGEWTLPLPPKTPTGAQPPALAGEIKGEGGQAVFTPGKQPSQQGVVQVAYGKLTAKARIRVAPSLPYRNNFDMAPAGSTPGGWVNAQGKFTIKEVEGGNKVLQKVNTDARPPLARANAYITVPNATGYTIACDLRATLVANKLPDMGLVANRYTLIVDGKTDPEAKSRLIRLTTWEARPRLMKSVPFDWQPNVWYSSKLTVDYANGKAIVKAKFWKKGDAEPSAWTIELEDPSPNTEGSAALYGYVSNIAEPNPGSEIHYDNLSITPNGGK